MVMKEREVFQYLSGLGGLGSLALPAKLSFAISCNRKMLQAEAEQLEQARLRLCERYAKKNEDGAPVMTESVVNGQRMREYEISGQARELLEQEYAELLDSETDVGIRTVGMDTVSRCEEADRYDILTVEQMNTLAFMLEE